MHDFIVLGIVSDSQTQILPRPIERAEVKFSLIHFHLFSLWFPIRFVPECSVLFFCFLLLFFLFRTYVILKTTSVFPYTFLSVTTFIISTLAIWVLDGQFVTNFVILYLSGSMKSIGHLLVGRLFRVCFFFFFFFFFFFLR